MRYEIRIQSIPLCLGEVLSLLDSVTYHWWGVIYRFLDDPKVATPPESLTRAWITTFLKTAWTECSLQLTLHCTTSEDHRNTSSLGRMTYRVTVCNSARSGWNLRWGSSDRPITSQEVSHRHHSCSGHGKGCVIPGRQCSIVYGRHGCCGVIAL